METTDVNYYLDVPSNDNNDTVVGNDVVIVKFDDYNFYPQYIVYYESTGVRNVRIRF